MTGGSQQLRLFRRAIRDGKTLEEACEATGGIITIGEGRIHLANDQKNPPPPEAFELLYDPDARAAASPAQEEPIMATAAKREDMDNQEYHAPDAAKAFDIYDNQIRPKVAKIDTARGECSQPWQDIKEHAHFPRPVMNFLLMLRNIDDDAKRDHFLLALQGGLEHLKFFVPDDLVTRAEGESGGSVVPSGARAKPKLATVGGTDAGDPPPADGEFHEASEEELAAQASRPSTEQAKADAEAAAELEDGPTAA